MYMNTKYEDISLKTSKIITRTYSTSFSIGIRLLHDSVRDPIYAIYGFVRMADEIVDTFSSQDQFKLFNEFTSAYHQALRDQFSIHPVIHAFQKVVHKYNIEPLVEDFLESMALDLQKTVYHTDEEIKQYIHGSADVVGLMCLKVFVSGNETEYLRLKPYAIKLGSAFQKVNFLRDLKQDRDGLGRHYFPQLNAYSFNDNQKDLIIEDIRHDFAEALIGIKALPMNSKFGVYVAYKYYLNLLKKLSYSNCDQILANRIRIPNYKKLFLLNKAYLRYWFNVL